MDKPKKTWTKVNVNFVIRNADKMSDREIAIAMSKRLGREISEVSVLRMRARRGIKKTAAGRKPGPWLRKLRDAGLVDGPKPQSFKEPKPKAPRAPKEKKISVPAPTVSEAPDTKQETIPEKENLTGASGELPPAPERAGYRVGTKHLPFR